MNTTESAFTSTDTVLNTLMIVGVAVSVTVLSVAQQLPAVTA